MFVHHPLFTALAALSIAGSSYEAVAAPIVKLSSRLSAPNADIVIAPGESVVIDSNAEVGFLYIHGQLRCPDTGSYTIKAEGIMIHGQGALFECGTPQKRFQGRLEVKLKNGRALSAMEGVRALSVMGGGTLQLFGREKNFQWQKIVETVNAGDSSVKMANPVDWSPGETLVLGPTGFDANEAERRIIKSVSNDRKTVIVTSPFRYKHNGVTYPYAAQGRQWVLDERAEVAVLDRNISVSADGDAASLDAEKVGGHIMVMATAKAYVDGVELSRMGQLGVMGRYPFHWHWAGNVPGQFIKNSSIHDSYQRCVTIHGTNQALVQNNFCFNHFGHGYFLENGNEVNNTIIGNLGMLSRRVPAGKGLLVSDMGPIGNARFSGPSTFWITNPTNTVRDNVASGSEGSGFWMAFSERLKCTPGGNCEFAENSSEANVFPIKGETTDFSNNIAHSSEVGITWDGAEDGPKVNNPLNPRARDIVSAHYKPSRIQKFSNLVVYKNIFSGVYFRGESVAYPNLIAADNTLSLFFAYNQAVYDSLIVGMSPNFLESELPLLRARGPWGDRPIAGALLYDGPFDLQRVHFADFNPKQIVYQGREFTPVPFFNGGGANRWVNSVKGLTFSPEPRRRTNFLDKDQWFDTLWTTGLRDQDGSLTGMAGSIVLPDHPLNRDSSCVSFEGALRCNYQLGVITAAASSMPAPYDANNVPFTVVRSDGAKSDVRTSEPYNNKTGLILDRGYSYQLIFETVRPQVLRLQFFTEKFGMRSPVVELVNLGASCKIENASAAPSLAALQKTDVTAYFKDDQDRLFIRMSTFTKNPSYQSEFGTKGTAPMITLTCQSNGLLDLQVFNESYYREKYSDLRNLTAKQLREHWIQYGIREGREASANFSSIEYVSLYSDLQAAFGDNREAAVRHYLEYGIREHRMGHMPDALGFIDVVSPTGRIAGWACSKGLPQSIGVQVYVGGPAGQGSLIATAMADQDSEPAVASACGSTGSRYRFSIQLSADQIKQSSGQPVYVHGLLFDNRINSLLNNSGQFRL